MKVFLGGTCNNSQWRDIMIPKLVIDYFNHLVDDWTPDCMAKEIEQRELCDICLYVITPEMTGVYSIAEVVDDSNKRPAKTIFCFTDETSETKFTEFQLKSLKQVGNMVERNNAKQFNELDQLIDFLNYQSIN